MVLAPLLIRTIYGQGYEPAATVLRILIWFFALTVTNTVYCVGLIVVGREREYAMNLLVGTIFHLGTNLVATLLWGIPGAAAAAVASEGLTIGLMYFRFRNVADIKFWLQAVKPLLGSIGMALLIYYSARYNLPLAIIIGIVSYALLLFLLRGVTPHDLREVGRLFSIRRDPCDRS
jgi:O-antigen/teichoic acid export membrane protein